MDDPVARTVGALIGAVSAVILCICFLFLLAQPSAGGFEGLWIFLVFLTVWLPVALAGAIAGWKTSGHIQAGNKRAAVKVCAIAAAGIFVWVLSYRIPERFEPADERRRARWARETNLREDAGRTLARQLDGALRRHRTARASDAARQHSVTLQRIWYELGEDSIAALGGYQGMDDGWRWKVVRDYPPRFIVFPDPLLRAKGPVFDVLPYLILRREQEGAPAHLVETQLPMVRVAHRCLVNAARQAKREGIWDGQASTIVAFFANVKKIDTCPLIAPPRESPWQSEAVVLSLGTGVHGQAVEVQIAASREETGNPPVELAFPIGGGSWYLMDANETLRMRNGARIMLFDPPPACFSNIAIACDEHLIEGWRP